jgi:uncharacterized protein involved in response to NO
MGLTDADTMPYALIFFGLAAACVALYYKSAVASTGHMSRKNRPFLLKYHGLVCVLDGRVNQLLTTPILQRNSKASNGCTSLCISS